MKSIYIILLTLMALALLAGLTSCGTGRYTAAKGQSKEWLTGTHGKPTYSHINKDGKEVISYTSKTRNKYGVLVFEQEHYLIDKDRVISVHHSKQKLRE